MPKKLTQEQVISRFREVHGDKYDYSKVRYVNDRTKVCIICKIHGKFYQQPNVHYLHKCGCPKCADLVGSQKRRKGKEEFIKRAKKIHGNKYIYDKVELSKRKDKVCIVCPQHGDFWQTMESHLNNRGCPICGKISSKRKKSKDTNWFIDKAKNIHGDKYLYDKSNYKNSSSKITITCRKHGDFEQIVRNHLHGASCPHCKSENISKRQNKTTEQFIQQAKIVHGDKYIYDLVVYTKKGNKVKIICPKHGIFEQTPNSHLCGTGCPHCKSSKGEERIAKYLTKNKIDFIRQFHILPDNLFCTTNVIIVDFYLPKNKAIIEFNGEQHYKPIKHFGGTKKFQKQQGRDFSLKLYCEHNNIGLIEIPYTSFNDIESILKQKLKIKR